MKQEARVVVIERDVDQDRFISYEHYKEFLREFPPLSKNQIYFMMLGVTGWRPNELCRAKLGEFGLKF